MLLRDGPNGLEVFMVVRHHKIDFASGALVFPGGKVDEADRDPALRDHCTGIEGLDDLEVAFRLAAIREAFEECGVLLARPRGEDALLTGARLAELEPRWSPVLRADEATLAEFVTAEKLDLACGLLAPFARWITPDHMPKRFDTYFFLAAAPADHIAIHDGSESVDSVWTRPADALAEADADRRTVIFPTRLNLEKLGRAASVAEAFAAAAATDVVTVEPDVEITDEGRLMRIPADADYGLTEALVKVERGHGGRIVWRNDRDGERV
jgi:8-oxo-dGTP pyrophosphatase MutT (NUDIX family)